MASPRGRHRAPPGIDFPPRLSHNFALNVAAMTALEELDEFDPEPACRNDCD
jgi:hypothetical protein